VTVHLPVGTLNRVEADPFTWQVPGLREELVTALVRSLPKQLRVNFVPAPNHARAFLQAVSPGEESLLDALERFLRSTTGVVVPRDAWDWSKVPDHLRPTFRVEDEKGKVVAEGKDLEALKTPLRPKFARAMAEAAEAGGVTVTGQTTWTFGTIERTFTQQRAGHEVRGFPALVDEALLPGGRQTVGLQVLGSEAEQEASMRLGLRRLLMLDVPSPVKQIASGLSNADKLGLAGSPYPSTQALLEDCVAAAVDEVVVERGLAWDEDAFASLLGAVRAEIEPRTRSVVHTVARVLAVWRDTDRLLSGSAEMQMLPALADMKAQTGRLVYRGFVADVGSAQLRELPRYLSAVQQRREKLPGQVGRDRLLMDQIASVQEAYLHRMEALAEGRPPSAGLRKVRWMLEELRVSLWAQQLGTAHPVSDTRIRKALDAA
jgi:ATP-dependent helicase HrpA